MNFLIKKPCVYSMGSGTMPSIKKTIVALGVAALGTLACAQDAALQNARSLMASGQMQAAYTLLAPLEAERAGQPDFDVLLGIAALDAGQHTRAIFALERVLAVQPDNALARAELGRAYLKAGEPSNAKTELTQVQAAKDVPTEARAAITKLLSDIDAFTVSQTQQAGQGQRSTHVFAELGITRDSNVNSGSNVTGLLFAIPGLGTFVLPASPQNRPRADNVAHVAAGVQWQHALSPATSLNANASLRQTSPNQNTDLDSRQIDASASVSHRAGAHQWSGSLSLGTSSFNGTQIRRVTGLSGQWLYSLSEQAQLSSFVQHSVSEYSAKNQGDTERSIAGLAYGTALSNNVNVYTSLYGGREHGDLEHNNSRIGGLRLGAEWALSASTKVFVNTAQERRKHAQPDTAPLYSLYGKRQDRQTDWSLGLQYKTAPTSWGGVWRITPVLSETTNNSNNPFLAYKRRSLALSARLDY
jgi:outer membrane protein